MDPRSELQGVLNAPLVEKQINRRGGALAARSLMLWAAILAFPVAAIGTNTAVAAGVAVFFAAIPFHVWYAWRLAAAEGQW
jgi:hypothetical protein